MERTIEIIESRETEIRTLNDAELDQVDGGGTDFRYYEMGGHTYACGTDRWGNKLCVRVT